MKFLYSMTDKILKGLGLLSGSYSSATYENVKQLYKLAFAVMSKARSPINLRN